MSSVDHSQAGLLEIDSAEQFAAVLRRRVLGERFRHAKALVAHAGMIGVSRSTIYNALGGQRLPSEYTLRRLLEVAAGADEAEIRRWVAARAQLDEALQGRSDGTDLDPPLPEPHPPGSPTDGDDREPGAGERTAFGRRAGRRWWGRAGWALGGALCGALVVLGSQLLLLPGAGPAGRDASTGSTCNPVPDDRPQAVSSLVVGTEGEGAYTHITPGGDCRAGFLPERSGIDVVCQVLDGPDALATRDGGLRRWPVWDRLADGAYVSDLYTDLPKPPAPALVDGLPRC